MALRVTPDAFHRVEYRRIGRQGLQLDGAAFPGDGIFHRYAAMTGQYGRGQIEMAK